MFRDRLWGVLLQDVSELITTRPAETQECFWSLTGLAESPEGFGVAKTPLAGVQIGAAASAMNPAPVASDLPRLE